MINSMNFFRMINSMNFQEFNSFALSSNTKPQKLLQEVKFARCSSNLHNEKEDF